MSVALISDAGLTGLWHGLGRTEDLGIALQALGIANRAAFVLTYAAQHENARTIDAPDFEHVDPAPVPVGDWSLLSWAENLLYNCVTNAGTDFAPARYANIVRAAARSADASASPRAHGDGSATRFSGLVRGRVTTLVTVADGCVTRVRVDDTTFDCDPVHDVWDDGGNDGLPHAAAIAHHVRAQTWPHWEFG